MLVAFPLATGYPWLDWPLFAAEMLLVAVRRGRNVREVAIATVYHAGNAGSLATGKDRDLLLDGTASKQHRTGDVENLLIRRPASGVRVEVIQDRALLGQARIDVLCIDTNLAAEAPAGVLKFR